MNDNAPRFEQTSYTCWLSEEATRGQLVTLVTASDPDTGPVQYSIAAGNQHHTFHIDPDSGKYKTVSLNYSKGSSFINLIIIGTLGTIWSQLYYSISLI